MSSACIPGSPVSEDSKSSDFVAELLVAPLHANAKIIKLVVASLMIIFILTPYHVSDNNIDASD